jgi:hypothetical protein
MPQVMKIWIGIKIFKRGSADGFDLDKGPEGKTVYTHGQRGYSKNKNAASEMNIDPRKFEPGPCRRIQFRVKSTYLTDRLLSSL